MISNLELLLMNAVTIECITELKIVGLLINDGRIMGRLDEEEDIILG